MINMFLRKLRIKKPPFVILHKPVYFNRHVNEKSDFLIITTGPTIKRYKEKVQKFINERRPTLKVIGCNFLDGLCIPDYHIITNRARFCTYVYTISQQSILLLSPYLAEWIIKDVISNRYYEKVMYKSKYICDKGSLKINRKGIICLKAGTLATVALGVALVMGAKNIFFAGLDGFSMYSHNPDDIHFFKDSDSISFEMRLMQERATHDILKDASDILRKKSGQIKIITPTVYKEYYDGSLLK